jgi:hypothetical protein
VTGDLARLLFATDVHPVRYVLRAWPLAMVPTFAIALVLSSLSRLAGLDHLFDESQWKALVELSKPMLLFQIVVFAPLAETLLMAPLLALLMRLFHGRRTYAALASAAVWAGLHSLSAIVWGLCIFWTFLVFSSAWLAWRPRSFKHAYFVTAGIHALNNSVAGLGLLVS